MKSHLGAILPLLIFTSIVQAQYTIPQICGADDFRCNSGKCIPKDKQCDRIVDCPDSEDEVGCDCKPGEFKCRDNNDCIEERKRCDGVEHCNDGSDELNCREALPPQTSAYFMCKDGTYILQSQRCNRQYDCPRGDYSDEVNCPCGDGDFKCDNGYCIPASKHCDRTHDCQDRSDERGCNYGTICMAYQYKCSSGQCVRADAQCNGTVECEDGSDETNCPCKRDEFQCRDGSCLNIALRCDNQRNCPGGEDEHNCGPQQCSPEEFSCAAGSSVPCAVHCDGNSECDNGEDELDCSDECEHPCDGRCLDPSLICNGVENCSDGTDEVNCDNCDGPEDFRCSNGECLRKSLRCNGLPDCTDLSDEEGCNRTMISSQECTENQFQCSNGVCLDSQFWCDDNQDCTDGSDEENCRCKEYQKQCRSGQCILENQFCDGIPDCPDNSDEENCVTPGPGFDDYPTTTTTTRSLLPDYPPRPPYPRPEYTPRPIYPRTEYPPYPQRPDSDSSNRGPAALDLKTYPSAQAVRHGGDVVFQCRDEGPLREPVRWLREDGRPLKSDSTDIKGRLEMSKVTTSDSGIYICQAFNYVGTPGSEIKVTLIVENPSTTLRPSFISCQPHEATCVNGQCIPKSAVCDGRYDCADQSDEETCHENGQCEPNQFHCDNRRCILKSWVCDSVDDCGDNSDERSCGVAKPGEACSPAEFTCGRNQCIPRSFHCDNHPDCLDGGSDEIGCTAVHVTHPPQPAHVRLNPGESLRLECKAAGLPVPFINWRLNWGHIPAKCSSTSENGVGILSCTDMQPEDSGAYSCEAVNNRGTSFGAPDSIVIVNRTSVCPIGYFNSEARSPSECIRCFCFGESTQCKSADLFIYNMPTPLGEGGTRLVGVQQDYNGGIRLSPNPITDQYYYEPLRNGATITKLEVYGYPTSTDSHPYLTLPESYNGNQLTSYGGYIRYRISPQSPRPSSGYDSNLPDIIIKGKHETLVYNRRRADPRDNNIEVRLTQDEWQKSTANGLVPAAREDVMMALDNVELILLRASVNGAGVNITDFAMESAQSINVGLGTANLVEECTCPPGYEGLSCQKCSAGYTRESSGAWLGNCVREAPRPCPAGMYGDPSSGAGCQPCPCPLTNPENQFARTCSLGPRGNVICDCAPGYEGEQCQYCSQGFVGNPLVAGDSCRRQVTSNCDPIGTLRSRLPDECECKQNVQGQYCDQCKDGSFHLSDDNRHGCAQCFCSGVTERCTSSNLRRKTTSVTYNTPQIVDEVSVYQSAPLGDGSAVRYDAPVEASARPQFVRGELVLDSVERSRNHIYYWSLPPSFALDKVTAYGGYLRYVLRNVPVSGASNNAPDIQLISHNRLTFHYFGDFKPSNDGVLDAQVQFLEKGWHRADGKGTTRQHFLLALADVKAILVKATYTTNYQIASLVSSSIDTADESGNGPLAAHVEQCVCPPGYRGTSCEDCAPGYTRSPRALYLKLCKPCECNGHSNMCDPESGECLECQDNTAGPSCEECKPGYRRDVYNNCVPQTPDRWPRPEPDSCNCDSRGTVDDGPRCDERGNCNCKQLATGESCDRCRQGSFGLSQDNPNGCIECYCSGVTSECYEVTNLFWDQIPAPMVGDLNYNNYTIMDLNARKVINDHFVPILEESELVYSFDFSPDEELFWSLPLLTLPGNMLLSYGGNLTFKQKFEVDNPYSVYNNPGTDVVLVGDEDSVYWTNPQSFRSGEYLFNQVPLLERNWFVLNSRVPASRNVFMGVLKNLKQVLVRATLADLNREKLSSTSIATVAMDKAGEERRPLAAKGIEVCRCPDGYTGRSCESCTAGYYRQRDRCLQCNCNGHNCHVGSYDQVVCDCPDRYSGPDCSIIDGDTIVPTSRPSPPQSSVTVTISSPTIKIQSVGGFVNFTCAASSRYRQGPLPVTWVKKNGYLPQGRHVIDQDTGTLTITQVQVSDSGTYICQTSDGIGTGQASATLTVGSNPMTRPSVSIRPSVQEYYEGDRIELECVTSGNPTPTIDWRRGNGQPLPMTVQHFESYLIIENAKEEDSGDYRCLASNNVGTVDRIASITVRPRPAWPPREKLTISPSTPNVVEGQNTNVVCTGTSNIPPGSIRWVRQDGAEFASNVQSQNGVLYIDVARLENQGVYTCQTSSGEAESTPVLVTVIPLGTPSPAESPKIEVNVNELKIPTGESGTVECSPGGYPLPRIQWTKHEGEFGSGTSQRGNTLIISNAQDDDRGYYVCTGTVDGNLVATTYVNVDIETRIRPRVQIWPQRDVRARIGDRFELRCQVLEGVPPPEIVWSRSRGRELSSDAQVGPAEVIKFSKIDVNDEGEYICNAGNKAGNDTATAVLKVWSPPEITITPDRLVAVKYGDPVEVKCRANGYPEPMVSIKLRDRSGSRVVVPATPSVASLRISSASESDEGDYLCSAAFLDQAVDDQFTIQVEDRGDIGFGTDEGSGDFDPYNPDQQPRASDLIVAEGQDSRLGCNYSGSYDYELTWSRLDQRPLQRNAQQIGNDLIIHNATKQDSAEYECNVVDRRTGYALHTAYVSLVVQTPPRITLRPITQTVSPGQSPTVECIVEGDDILDVSWNPVEKPFSRRVDVRGSTLIFRRIEVEDAGNYTCSARNRVAPASAVAQVLVSGPREEEQALVAINQPYRQYQVGENVEVVCRALARNVDVRWQRFGSGSGLLQHVDQRPFGEGSSLILNSVAEPDAGVYRCTGTDQYQRTSYDDFTLQILPAPESPPYPSNQEDTTLSARLGQPAYIPCPRLEQPASVEWRREYSSLAPNIRANEPNLYIPRVSETDAGTYICRVSNGRTTTEARVILLVTGVVPQFNRYSWLAMPALSDAYTQFDIEISFKPTDSDGLILYDNGSSGHFIALRLVNSQPEIVLDAGSGPITVMGDRPLQLNTWHTVRLSRMNTKVTMNVDDAGPFTTEMPTKLAVMELDQPLHIGGVPDLSQLPPALAGTQGFSGCVGMLVLGKQEKDIMMDSHKNRVTECDSCSPNMCLHGGVCQEARNERGYVCLCPSGFAGQNCDHAGEGCRPHICGPGKCTEIGDTYKCSCPITHTGHNCERQQSIEYPAFTGSAYLAIPAPQSMRGLYMSLKIKAMSPVTDGIIMYCAESEQGHGGFTSLAVRDQRVEFRYQTGDALQPVILTSHRELRPNEWTEVTIARTGSMVRLRINQNTDSVSSVLPYTRQAGDLHLKTAMYVGGVDDSNIILNNNTGVAGGFSGCIKDVNVQDSAVNIVNASIISANVQECSSYDRGDIPDEDSSVCSRCRNDGRCATPDATACTCPPGYSGTYCQNRAPQSPCSPNPCKRGTCRIDRGSRLNYTCDCPLGFSGINCHIPLELHQSVAFDGNGYVELAAENLIYDEDPVEFGAAIITTNADGILMYQRESTGRGQGDYFLLRLENARAVLEIDLGAGPMVLTEEGVDVSNGERHVIVVRMYKNKQIELAVEGRSKIQVYEGLTSVMNADSNIYVGGMPEALNVWQYPGMTGCFESIQLNKNHRQSVDLNVAAVAARNAQRCKDIRRN